MSGLQVLGKTVVLSIALLCLLGTSAPADATKKNGPVTLSIRDNGEEITVSLGDILVVELEQPGATGYEWHVDAAYKNGFVLLKEGKKSKAKKGIVGSPMVKTWHFKAIKRGVAELAFFLYRDWEGQKNAESRFKVNVKIL